MANVPVIEGPSQALPGVGTPTLPPAMGSAEAMRPIAQGLGVIGQEAENLSRQQFQIDAENQAFGGETEFQDQSNALTRDANADFMKLHGMDAVKAAPAVKAKLLALRDQILDKMDSHVAKRLVANNTLRQLRFALEFVDARAEQQRKVAVRQTSTLALQSSVKAAGNLGFSWSGSKADVEQLGKLLGDISMQAHRDGDAQGLEGADLDAYVTKMQGTLMDAFFTVIGKTASPATIRSLLDLKVGERPEITPSTEKAPVEVDDAGR